MDDMSAQYPPESKPLARWREIDALEPGEQDVILSVVDSLRMPRPATPIASALDRRNGDEPQAANIR